MTNICNILSVKLLLSRNNLLCRSVQVKYFRVYSSNCRVPTNVKQSDTSYQSVVDFYSGKSVFITGGTGFLGKVFIEKLLYSCSKLDKMYLLIREKQGKNIHQRIENVFNNPVFLRLKTSNPDFMKKVVPVLGDVTSPNLGLTSEDEKDLIDKVSVVFHAAATIKFNESLPVAMNINFEGTQKVLELSQRMKNIEAFVYISTAYTQTEHKTLLEKIYPSPAKLEDVYKFIQENGHDEKETIKFIKDKPNTYAFSKAMTESYVANNCGNMPTVIIRPSIVTATKDEPIKGWLDNWLGGTPHLHNVAKGRSRLVLGDGNYLVDLIPVDYVSNMSIVAATRARSNDLQVFNCTTTSENPIAWSDAYKYYKQGLVFSGKNVVPSSTMLYSKSRALVNIGTLFLETIPAHIADLWLKIIGKDPKYVRLVNQAVTYRDATDFFTANSWVKRSDRAGELYNSLSPEDKIQFPFDVTQINWSEYMQEYCKGAQRYLATRFSTK